MTREEMETALAEAQETVLWLRRSLSRNRVLSLIAARRQRIKEEFQPGVSAAHIARALGVSKPTIGNDLRAMGWLPVGNARGRAFGKVSARRAAIVATAAAEPTRSLQSLGDQFGVTRERIRQILADAGQKKPRAVDIRSIAKQERLAEKARAVAARKADRRALSHLRLAQAMAMRQRGMAYSQIAAEFGLKNAACAATMYARARAAGITVSP